MFNYDKLEKAIEQSGKTKTYLCKKLDRPAYYLRDILRQKNNIPAEYQQILAMELGVTVAYLNDAEDKEKPALIEGEQIPGYNQLTPENQEFVQKQIALLLAAQQEN